VSTWQLIGDALQARGVESGATLCLRDGLVTYVAPSGQLLTATVEELLAEAERLTWEPSP
jgi:hypothetical protein